MFTSFIAFLQVKLYWTASSQLCNHRFLQVADAAICSKSLHLIKIGFNYILFSAALMVFLHAFLACSIQFYGGSFCVDGRHFVRHEETFKSISAQIRPLVSVQLAVTDSHHYGHYFELMHIISCMVQTMGGSCRAIDQIVINYFLGIVWHPKKILFLPS